MFSSAAAAAAAAPSSTSSSSSAAASSSGGSSRADAVDASGAERTVWLVKVPEVVAELVRAGDDAADTVLGEFVALGGPPARAGGGGGGGGAKRPRVALKLTLNRARIAEVAGADAARCIPSRYTLTLEPGTGARLLAQPPGGGFAFVGTAGWSGTLVPDVADPAYAAYTGAKRARELAAASQRAVPRLAEGPSALGVLAAASRTSATGSSGGGGGGGQLVATAVTGGGGSALRPDVPRVATLFALFEAGPYWGLREVAAALGRRETDVKPELAKMCDYLKRGPHKGRYKLKPEWRTVSSAPVEEDDGIAAAAAAAAAKTAARK